MYCTDFICTYKMHDKDDQIHIYRIQLLQAFNMTDYDEKNLETNINTLYTEVNENQFVCEILNLFFCWVFFFENLSKRPSPTTGGPLEHSF